MGVFHNCCSLCFFFCSINPIFKKGQQISSVANMSSPSQNNRCKSPAAKARPGTGTRNHRVRRNPTMPIHTTTPKTPKHNRTLRAPRLTRYLNITPRNRRKEQSNRDQDETHHDNGGKMEKRKYPRRSSRSQDLENVALRKAVAKTAPTILPLPCRGWGQSRDSVFTPPNRE